MKVKITKQCFMCRDIHAYEYDKEAVDKWQAGMLIQQAMPNETPERREFLISGMCFDCQKKIFGI